MKKLIALLCMFTCILSLTACTHSENSEFTSNYDESALREGTESIITQLQDMDDAYLESIVNMRNEEIAADDETALMVKASYQSWLDSKDELGGFDPQESDTCTLTADADGATLTLNATFNNRQGKITAHFDPNSQLISFNVEPVYSTLENLESAGLNTVLGMGTVFAVLIFIAFIISLFKFIHKAEQRMAERKFQKEAASSPQTTAAQPAAPAAGPIPEPVDEEVEDLELVAVITAAVAASMNTSVDKLVVRSIKRKSTNKWQKA